MIVEPGTPGEVIRPDDGAVGTGNTATDGCGPHRSNLCALRLRTPGPTRRRSPARSSSIDRGLCGFHVKAYNAQINGAIGVIIANVAGSGAPTVPPNMAVAAGVPAVTIPTTSMNFANGELLRTQLAVPNTVNATLKPATPATADSSVRWMLGEDDTAAGLFGPLRDMWTPTCFGNPGKVSDAAVRLLDRRPGRRARQLGRAQSCLRVARGRRDVQRADHQPHRPDEGRPHLLPRHDVPPEPDHGLPRACRRDRAIGHGPDGRQPRESQHGRAVRPDHQRGGPRRDPEGDAGGPDADPANAMQLPAAPGPESARRTRPAVSTRSSTRSFPTTSRAIPPAGASATRPPGQASQSAIGPSAARCRTAARARPFSRRIRTAARALRAATKRVCCT